jgi:hypothetical protein
MMRRFFLPLILLFAFLVISTFLYFRTINAQETSSSMDSSIIEKLDKILENQKDFLQRLDNLRKEVRARCSH